MSTERIPGYAGFVDSSKLPRGPNGRPLCRWCAEEVPPTRRTFCGPACIHEHKIRTQPAYAKEQVWERDHGVCAICGVDTAADLKGPIRPPVYRWLKACCSRFDMDHIKPVVEGGGACGLENLRTLCKPHHRQVTAELTARRARTRRIAKAVVSELEALERKAKP